MKKLTEAELKSLCKELADNFDSQLEAQQLVDAAGLPLRRHPIWGDGMSRQTWWRKIIDLLTAGATHAVPEAAIRLLIDAAREERPTNPFFRKASKLLGAPAPARRPPR